jgi:uncharacterized protein YndB with AHSA1/START domain/DNA-binding transcriptional ArsR family regulator
LDDLFRALADPGRRRLLDSLNDRNGQTLRELTECLDMARQSVSKHLGILAAANLVTTVRRGREKYHYLNSAPISEIAQRWIGQYHQQRVDALSDLKRALEDTPMDKPEFVYTTYIRTTPKQLWQALTEPAFTQRYWGGVAMESDWQTGSVFTLTLADGTRIADPAQVIVAADPYRRLAYTWHTFTPQWAAHYDIDEADLAAWASEPRSTVTFDIEDQGPLCKLTVLHDGFAAGSAVLAGVSQGWPRIVADLKTLLETGDLEPAR